MTEYIFVENIFIYTTDIYNYETLLLIFQVRNNK